MKKTTLPRKPDLAQQKASDGRLGESPDVERKTIAMNLPLTAKGKNRDGAVKQGKKTRDE